MANNTPSPFITQNSPFFHVRKIESAIAGQSVQTMSGYMILQQYIGDGKKYKIVGTMGQGAENKLLKFIINAEDTAKLPVGIMFYSIYIEQPYPPDLLLVETGTLKVIGAP